MLSSRITKYKFIRTDILPFGKALYIIGNILQLGSWKPQNAIRLQWNEQQKWSTQVILPVIQSIRFKYIKGGYNSIFQQIEWQNGQDHILNLSYLQNIPSNFSIMTFNIRNQNGIDGQNSWENRRQKCVEMLFEESPAIFGIQQAKPSQKQFLLQKLKNRYDYIGISRDLKFDQQVGIFYQISRFILIDSGFVWYSEEKVPGKIGFDCKHPRNLTYIVIQDNLNRQKILIINTHFDNISKISQSKSVDITLDTISNIINQNIKYRNSKIESIYIIGDFNIQQDEHIFGGFYEAGYKSCRKNAIISNLGNTFHNFKGQNWKISTRIDHIFYLSNNIAKQFKIIEKSNPYLSDHYPVIGLFKH